MSRNILTNFTCLYKKEDQDFVGTNDLKGSNVNGDNKSDNNVRLNGEEENDPLGLEFDKKREPIDEDGHGPYVPGSLTEPDHRHESYDLLLKDSIEQIHGPQEDQTDKFWRRVAENANQNEQAEATMKYGKRSELPKLPYVNVTQNFNFAKKMHVGNLEHQPLPDTLGYRNMTKVGEHRDSDIVVKPYAIGWKGYGASGPTCCTKMRVHRPKTCDQKKTDDANDRKHSRPYTSAPDLGGQYKKPMSLMDLAICWDFRPNDSKLEPTPPKHIDGSNGSKAPAVFTMVHTPKEEAQNAIGHSFPIFNQNRIVEDVGRHPVPNFEKDMTKEKRKGSCDVQHCSQHNDANIKSRSSSRKSSAASAKSAKCDGVHGCGTPSTAGGSTEIKRPDKLQAIKDAWASNAEKSSHLDINRNRNSLESYDQTPLAQGKLRHSSPNESIAKHSKDSTNVKHKHCFSCNGVKVTQGPKPREDYKFAFKAGNPNSVQSVSSGDSKAVKMPKMRHPYTKKSYTIPTLAPPFSIWRDANATGYPEHWRLASVYQHAYKPPEQRRKPLIDSVYQ